MATRQTTIDKEVILSEARRVLKMEGEAILSLQSRIGEEFLTVVQLILNCPGRLVVTGIGKTGHISNKLAATFASTGTPSFFLHPAEGVHGDLGMVTGDDIVLMLSNSGETSEVLALLPSIRRIGATVVAMTGNRHSTLAELADYILECRVEREACPLGLAPTSSSTATLAYGDALAMALLRARDFRPEDFAVYHPGGSLGRRLLLRIRDVMQVRSANPIVSQDITVQQALFAMTSSRMGAVSVVDEDGILLGIITDGDIRRGLEAATDNILNNPATSVMTSNPITITEDELATTAVRIMEDKEITHLPVIDGQGRPTGMVNIQDLLKAGVI